MIFHSHICRIFVLLYMIFLNKYILDVYSEEIDVGENSPQVPPTTTRGMIIDAGSGGSRLHVYRWSPRIFDTVPPPLSYPLSDEKWTGRIAPAIQTYVNNLDQIIDHITPLIDFAKSVLAELEDEYMNYPIFFKATGGMRELCQADREKILNKVRALLSDKNICPFYFRNDFARVISGEEEAIYSWCATNLLMGSLLPASLGQGTVVSPNSTYGTLDLGGSSTQIAFYAPDQDILDGLFKLQIGSQKHWNVYAKSFLEFGVNSVRNRHLVGIANDYAKKHPKEDVSVVPSALSYCFHAGYSERVYDTSKSYLVEIIGPAVPAADQLERCMKALRPMLYRGGDDSYCNTVYHGQCSIGDSYQPPLPVGKHGQFIGTSSYTYPWKFLLLPTTASLDQVRLKAAEICSLDFAALIKYYENNNLNLLKDKISDQMPYFCFLSSYILVLLHDGYGFNYNRTLTVLDEVKGNKVTWALGAILYEINALPWKFNDSSKEMPWGMIFLSSCIGLVIGAIASFFIAKELFTDPIYMHHFDHDHVINNSQSNDSISTTISNQSSSLYGRMASPRSFMGNEKSLISSIPQFNPFGSRTIGVTETVPRSHVTGVVHIPTELTPLNGGEAKSNGNSRKSYV